MTAFVSSAATRVSAILLCVIGAVMLAGGTQLALAGGSIYYAVAGLAVVVSGILFWRRRPWADHLYALMLAATLVWAVWEVGLSRWELMPRLVGPAILGILLFAPHALALWRRRRFRVLAGTTWAAGLVCLGVVGAAFLAADSSSGSAVELPVSAARPDPADSDWLHYGNTVAGTRYSSLSQLRPDNVGGLELAWTHRSGDPLDRSVVFESTPLKIGDTLYTCTPHSVVIAIDARTGIERWRHDPKVPTAEYPKSVCRGVSYFRNPGAVGICAERLLSPTLDGRLLALDAATGRLCPDFGRNGEISLTEHLGKMEPTRPFASSPPAIVNGHAIVGLYIVDNSSTDMPSGVVRSYDPVTGELQWAWDAGAPERTGAPEGDEPYTRSTPNAWTIFSADADLNMVYIPTGSASPDMFGGKRRSFDEKYATSLVALDVATGRPRWSFQITRHDLWDYDVSAQPTLIDLPTGAGVVPVVIQATKQGDIYVLDRRSGKPVVPVTERSVSRRGAVPDDPVSAAQPFSALRVAPPPLTEASMWGVTPIDQMMCRIQFRQSRYNGVYTPPGLTPNIIYPGMVGGINWGGVSVEDDRKIAVVNSTNFPFRMQLLPRADVPPEMRKRTFAFLMKGTPYAASPSPFMGPLDVPCSAPPWGELTAIDLRSQRILWRRPFGTGYDTGPMRIASRLPLEIGVPNMGGAVTTAGGLIFISATMDQYLRAYDLRTGRELWKARLPAGGQATPMTYMAGGRQFVVISVGGHNLLRTAQGDYTMAFALPE